MKRIDPIELVDAMADLDDSMLEDAWHSRKSVPAWLRFGSLAACVAAVLVLAVLSFVRLSVRQNEGGNALSPEAQSESRQEASCETETAEDNSDVEAQNSNTDSTQEDSTVPAAENSGVSEAAQAEDQTSGLPEEPLQQLEASDAYGSIYPYTGTSGYDAENELYYNDDIWFGFVTGDGNVVTESVYMDIYQLCWYDDAALPATVNSMPFWVYSTEGDDWTRTDAYGDSRTEHRWYGFASMDGSFATDCIYEEILGYDQYILAYRDCTANLFEIYDLEGNLLLNSAELEFYDRFPAWVDRMGYGGGVFNIELDDGYWFMSPTGELLQGPYRNLDFLSCGWALCMTEASDGTYFDAFVNLDGEIMQIPDTEYIYRPFYQDRAVILLRSGAYIAIDTEGNILQTIETDRFEPWSYGYCSYEADGSIDYYDWQLNLCCAGVQNSDPYTSPDVYYVTGLIATDILWTESGDSCTLRNLETGAEITIPGCQSIYGAYSSDQAYENRFLVGESEHDENGARTYWLLDRDLNILYEGALEPGEITDSVTGTQYLTFADEEQGICEIQTMDQETLLTISNYSVMGSGQPTAVNGKFLVETETASELYDSDGSLIFSSSFS